MVEFALMAPWFFFLAVGALDLGFYAYALICTESAARAAAMYTSINGTTAADRQGACDRAWDELKTTPNVARTVKSNCTSDPVTVTLPANPATFTGPDAAPATQVTVSYRTISLIPIPGLIPAQITITQTATMRRRS